MIMEHLQIELPEKYKNVIKDATIEIVDGNIIITPKKQEFKDGDIVFWESKSGSENNGIGIVKSNINKAIYFYFDLVKQAGLIIDSAFVMEINVIARLATEEEKQKLFDLLENNGKKWNPETKQIEDILKVGDLAIFWNKNKKEAIVSEILETNNSGVPYRSTYSWFNNAIKCTSLEQYINFKK